MNLERALAEIIVSGRVPSDQRLALLDVLYALRRYQWAGRAGRPPRTTFSSRG